MAGRISPKIARVCQMASEAFQLPVNLNIYSSGPGLTSSIMPHSDMVRCSFLRVDCLLLTGTWHHRLRSSLSKSMGRKGGKCGSPLMPRDVQNIHSKWEKPNLYRRRRWVHLRYTCGVWLAVSSVIYSHPDSHPRVDRPRSTSRVADVPSTRPSRPPRCMLIMLV